MLPPALAEATEPAPVIAGPPARAHAAPLPRWSGWRLRLPPGRVSSRPPLPAPAPAAPANDGEPAEKPFRRRCQFCRDFFRDQAAYLYHPCKIQTFPMVLLYDFIHEQLPSGEGRRKCSPFPRAKSRSFTKTVKRREEKRRAEAGQVDLLVRHRTTTAYERNPRLPVLREECKGGQRPCPMVSCRAHMAFTVNDENGSIKENFPHFRIWKDPAGPGLHALEALHGTCSLDIADEIQAAMMGGADGDGLPGLIALVKTAALGQPIGTTEGYTLEQTAKRLGLSIERVRQIGARAMQEVRVALRRADGASPGRRA